MSTPNDMLLRRLCSKQETLATARELFNLAKAKTGMGSGHQLGANVVGLPAIVALLASQRLGNDDVSEEVAQRASCLARVNFVVALHTVRRALSGHLSKRPSRSVSATSLARNHGLDDNAIYWIEETEKTVEKSGELERLNVEGHVLACVVFYWTCTALHIRAVKSSALMAEHGIRPRDFQDVAELLDEVCEEVKERIDRHSSEARSSRSIAASPVKSSPSKSLSTPSRPRTRQSISSASSPQTTSPQKRPIDDAIIVATPVKRRRMLEDQTPASSTSRPSISTPSTGLRTYGSARSIKGPTGVPLRISPTKLSPVKPKDPRTEREMSDRLTRLALAERGTPKAQTEAAKAGPSKVQSSPTKNIAALRQRRSLTPDLDESDDDMNADMASLHSHRSDASAVQSVVDASIEDENEDDPPPSPPPTRRLRRPFADRAFFFQRDPRVLREWEICGAHVQRLRKVEKYPFGDWLEETAAA